MRNNAILKAAAACMLAAAMVVFPSSILAQGAGAGKAGTNAGTLLKTDEMQKLLPASVYYCGQSANTQLRNSGGVKFADGRYVLASLVDTAGYSTAIAGKYQLYFIVEAPIKLGGKTLAAGIYGAGFVGDKFVITDVGAHDVLTVPAAEDAAFKHLMPLQVLAGPAGDYRIYAGRKYVSFTR